MKPAWIFKLPRWTIKYWMILSQEPETHILGSRKDHWLNGIKFFFFFFSWDFHISLCAAIHHGYAFFYDLRFSCCLKIKYFCRCLVLVRWTQNRCSRPFWTITLNKSQSMKNSNEINNNVMMFSILRIDFITTHFN